MKNEFECHILVWDDEKVDWLVPIVKRLSQIRPSWKLVFNQCDKGAIEENHPLKKSWEDLRQSIQGENQATRKVCIDVYHSRGAEKVNFTNYCMLLTDALLRTTYPGDDVCHGIDDSDILLEKDQKQYGLSVLARKAAVQNPDISILCMSHHLPNPQDKMSVMEGTPGQLLSVVDKNNVIYGKNPNLIECLAHLIVGTVLRWDKAAENRRLNDTNSALTSTIRGETIGESEAIKKVQTEIKKFSDNTATVLILGESGTGKELAAKALHRNSSRRDNPFIACSCAAFNENLLESELFGHVKGAFTGATSDRIGRIEMAKGGTLFLDEVGEISPAIQVKLLRVIQEREYELVGSSKTIKADVRIIAATNRDLQKEIKKGTFREDLYYRLSVISLNLPPLRDRSGDVKVLARHFLKVKAALHNKQKVTGFSDKALTYLEDYDWPGNVRELEHAVERAVLSCEEDKIQASDLPERVCFGLLVCDENSGHGFPIFPLNLVGKARALYKRMTGEESFGIDQAINSAGVTNNERHLLRLLISGLFIYRYRDQKSDLPNAAINIFGINLKGFGTYLNRHYRTLPDGFVKEDHITPEGNLKRVVYENIGRAIDNLDSVT